MPSSPVAAALAAALVAATAAAPPAAGLPAEDVPADMSAQPAPDAPPPAAAPVPKASQPAPRPEGPAPPPAVDLGCHGSNSCQRLVALGAVAGGLGLAGIAAGTVLLLRPTAVDPGDPTTLISYRPAGAAALVVGTGLVATWVLTLLAARRAAKLALRRKTARAAPHAAPLAVVRAVP